MDTTHDPALQWAHHRANRKLRNADDLIKYLIVTGLLLVLARPIGVIVGIVWGLSLASRLFHTEVEGKLRRRMVRSELRRYRRHARGRRPRRRDRSAVAGGAPDPLEDEPDRWVRSAEHLAHRMGDDPDEGAPVDWASTALAELDDVENGPTPPHDAATTHPTAGGALRTRAMRMADVVESAVDSLRDQADRAGIDLRLEIDSLGEMVGDPRLLRGALRDLLKDAMTALDHSDCATPRIVVQMGEDLSGTEVWVRIRDNRVLSEEEIADLDRSRLAVESQGGEMEVIRESGGGAERLITFEKPDLPKDGDR